MFSAAVDFQTQPSIEERISIEVSKSIDLKIFIRLDISNTDEFQNLENSNRLLITFNIQ